MAIAVKAYDAKLDSKRRITLRNAQYEYYHVEEFEDGRIVLEPRELVPPFSISEKSLAIEPHPNDSKSNAYKKITLSLMQAKGESRKRDSKSDP